MLNDKFVKSFALDSLYNGLVKLIDVGSLLIISLMLTKVVGISSFGVFTFFEKIIFLGKFFLVLGLDRVLLKRATTSLDITLDDKKTFTSIIKIIGFGFLILSLLTLLVLVFTNRVNDIQSYQIIFISVILPTALLFIVGTFLIGKRYIWQGSLFKQTLGRIFFIITVLCSIILIDGELSILSISILLLTSRVLCIPILYALIKFPEDENITDLFVEDSSIDKTKLINEGLPYFSEQIINVLFVQSPIYLLGLFTVFSDVGLYDIAFKISTISLLPLTVSFAAVATRTGLLLKKNALDELQSLISTLNRFLRWYGLVFLIVITVFGNFILSIWGISSSSAYYVLLILTITQVLNLFFGPIEEILKIGGFEKKLAKIIFLTFVFNIVLGVVLGYLFAMMGIVVAFFISSVVYNFAKKRCLQDSLGLNIGF